MKNGPLTALRDGDCPQFEMDFLGGEGGGRIGDSPRDLAPCVRVSRRARRLSVRVYPDARVEVVVPPRARAREVELFVNAHRQWIDDKRTAALRSRPPPEPFPPATIHFQATGESWRLHLAGGEGRLLLAEIDGGKGRILQVSGRVSAAGLRTALRAWLMRAAQSRIAPRVVALSKSTVFGVLIALIACYHGMRVLPNTESLGRRTTSSVVISITIVILVDALFAVLFKGVGFR